MAQERNGFGSAVAGSQLEFDGVGGEDSNMEEFAGRMGLTKERASDFFSNLPLPPILIAVMGKKDSGKTSFINAVTGVSADPSTSTRGIRFVETELCGRSVTFIDTPGCDADMPGVISQCLEAATSRGGVKISGAIYLHRITDSQMDGSHAANTRKLFTKLCGDGDSFENVVLCTTMWEKVARGNMREKQLCGDSTFWGDMIREGALVERHQGPDLGASARRIAEILVNKRLAALRNRVLSENKAFFETAAGKMWIREREEMEGKHARELQQLKDELRCAVAARDVEVEGFTLAVEVIEKMKDTRTRKLQQLKTELQDSVVTRITRDMVFALVVDEVVEQMGQLRAKLQDADGLIKAQPLGQLMWRINWAQGKVSDARRLAEEVTRVLSLCKSLGASKEG